MPNTKSALKAMRQSQKRRAFNLITKDKYKDALKAFRKLTSAGKKSEALEAMKKAVAQIDKAAKKRVLHKNKASRLKSRMAKAVSKMTA